MTSLKPSLLEVTREAKGAFILGCGGGGDVIQTIPVMNYLKRLGVERFVLGEYCIKWWDKPGFVPFGCEIINLDRLQPSKRLNDNVVLVNPDTRIERGNSEVQPESSVNIPLYEAVVAKETNEPVVSVNVANGAEGILSGIKDVMEKYRLDLFITVDIGADAFYSGEETTVQSPLADAFSLYVANDLNGYYALTGYACDAELPNAYLDKNVAKVMQAGGYVGAHGLTSQDVSDLTKVLNHFPDEAVEMWPRDAALGKLGTHICKGLWYMYVSPLAAVTMFFDPEKIVELNPIPVAIAGTTSLYEAEQIILDKFNVIPESRLPMEVAIPTAPQIK